MAECVHMAHCSASIDHAVCLACSFDEALMSGVVLQDFQD